MGVAPIIGFNFGAGNKPELQNIFRKSVVVLTITNITMFVMAQVLTVPMAKIFVGYDHALNELTVRGMRIYSVAFLVMGFNVFASAFFYGIKQREDFGDFVCNPYINFAVGHDICPSDTVRCGRPLGCGDSSRRDKFDSDSLLYL